MISRSLAFLLNKCVTSLLCSEHNRHRNPTMIAPSKLPMLRPWIFEDIHSGFMNVTEHGTVLTVRCEVGVCISYDMNNMTNRKLLRLTIKLEFYCVGNRNVRTLDWISTYVYLITASYILIFNHLLSRVLYSIFVMSLAFYPFSSVVHTTVVRNAGRRIVWMWEGSFF